MAQPEQMLYRFPCGNAGSRLRQQALWGVKGLDSRDVSAAPMSACPTERLNKRRGYGYFMRTL